MTISASETLIRYLGPSEAYFWLSNQNSWKHFVVAAQITGETTTASWRTALDAVQRRHPLLGVCINADDSGAPYFRLLPELRIPLQIVPGDALQTAAPSRLRRARSFSKAACISARSTGVPSRSFWIRRTNSCCWRMTSAIARARSSARSALSCSRRSRMQARRTSRAVGRLVPPLSDIRALASKATEAVRPCTSASPPKADVNSPPWLPPLSAITGNSGVFRRAAK